MSDTVLAAVIGLVAGSVGSVVAPWAAWGVDKRRLTHEDRRKAIAEWRQGLMDWLILAQEAQTRNMPLPMFGHQSWFASLSRHLSAETSAAVTAFDKTYNPNQRGKHFVYVSGPPRPPIADEVARDIDRLAKAWRVT